MVNLDELQELVDKATPGTWRTGNSESDTVAILSRYTLQDGRNATGFPAVCNGGNQPGAVNAALICAMHNAMPALLAELRAAQALRAAIIAAENATLDRRNITESLSIALACQNSCESGARRALWDALAAYDKVVNNG